MDVNIWMISGDRMVGKTTFCQAMIQTARRSGWDVAGLLSPAIFKDGIKESIWAEDIRYGEKRPLAAAIQQGESDLILGNWFFNRQTLAWGNQVLHASIPCDLLVIDELGPLEFKVHTGWMAAFDVLESSRFHLALVVIRPELVKTAKAILQPMQTIQINDVSMVNALIHVYASQMIGLKGD